uniref:Uncharacterized protein n=1 Tax=Oryza nivara TaxID=4536 RepID=A0A0E0J903_ORYNI
MTGTRHRRCPWPQIELLCCRRHGEGGRGVKYSLVEAVGGNTVSSRPPVPPCLPPPLPLEEEHGFRMGMVTTRWPGAATATGNGDRERDRESEDEGDAPPSLSMAADLAPVPSPARGRREECEGTRAFWLIVVDFVASGSEGTTTETAEQQLSERGA